MIINVRTLREIFQNSCMNFSCIHPFELNQFHVRRAAAPAIRFLQLLFLLFYFFFWVPHTCSQGLRRACENDRIKKSDRRFKKRDLQNRVSIFNEELKIIMIPLNYNYINKQIYNTVLAFQFLHPTLNDEFFFPKKYFFFHLMMHCLVNCILR